MQVCSQLVCFLWYQAAVHTCTDSHKSRAAFAAGTVQPVTTMLAMPAALARWITSARSCISKQAGAVDVYSAAGYAADVGLLSACHEHKAVGAGSDCYVKNRPRGFCTTNSHLAAQHIHTLSKAWSTRLTPTSIRGAGLGTRAFWTSSPCDSFAFVITAAPRLCLCARLLTGMEVAVTRRQALIDRVVACLNMQLGHC